MNVREAAARLGVGESTVYDLVTARRIAHYRVGMGKGKIVFDRADVEAYRESCRVEAGRPSTAPRPSPGRDPSPTLSQIRADRAAGRR